MESIFNNCSSLVSLNLSNCNTINVNNMRYNFSECSSLTFLNFKFYTNNVIDMDFIFYKATISCIIYEDKNIKMKY